MATRNAARKGSLSRTTTRLPRSDAHRTTCRGGTEAARSVRARTTWGRRRGPCGCVVRRRPSRGPTGSARSLARLSVDGAGLGADAGRGAHGAFDAGGKVLAGVVRVRVARCGVDEQRRPHVVVDADAGGRGVERRDLHHVRRERGGIGHRCRRRLARVLGAVRKRSSRSRHGRTEEVTLTASEASILLDRVAASDPARRAGPSCGAQGSRRRYPAPRRPSRSARRRAVAR